VAGLTPPAPRRTSSTTPLVGAAALVAAGGTVGVLVRALLEQTFPAAPGAWPWTTFWINVTGSLVLGVLLGWLQRGPDVGARRRVRLGAGTGVIGGYTTYSTFVIEVEQLLTGGHAATGVVYALVSVVLGVAVAIAGSLLVPRVPVHPVPPTHLGRAGRDGRDAAGGAP